MNTVGHLLNATATVTRLTATNVRGRITQVPTVLTPLPCRVPHGAGPRDQQLGDTTSAKVTDVSYVMPGADVVRNDLWVVNGKNYRVAFVRDPSLPHHRKVYLEEVQRG